MSVHLLVDVDVTGVDAVSEQVFCASITAAQVAVVKQLPVQAYIELNTHRKQKKLNKLNKHSAGHNTEVWASDCERL